MTTRIRIVSAALYACLAAGAFLIGRNLPHLLSGEIELQASLPEKQLVSSGSELPEAPAVWIPVVADVRLLELGHAGNLEIRERYYRHRNGSVRIEAFSPVGEQKVTIHNVPAGQTYYQSPNGSWSSYPLGRLFPRTPPLTPFIPRAATVHLDTLGAQQVVVITGPDGMRSWLAPQLNYLEVKGDYGNGRHVREFYNIQAIDSDSSLFNPPAGVPIRPASSLLDLYR